eukprot:IDg21317t1
MKRTNRSSRRKYGEAIEILRVFVATGTDRAPDGHYGHLPQLRSCEPLILTSLAALGAKLSVMRGMIKAVCHLRQLHI